MRDDTILEDGDVKEALRRLPENQYNDRVFRIKRALDLSMKHQILPKDQWTKYEEVCLKLLNYFAIVNMPTLLATVCHHDKLENAGLLKILVFFPQISHILCYV